MNEQIIPLLERIAVALERLANDGKPAAPNLTRPMEEYGAFDWASIGAEIVRRDDDGPTHIQHNGVLYTRRSPTNKYDPAIWYSAPAGKDAEGNTEYVRLITFKHFGDADPLPSKVTGEIKQPAPATQPPPAPAPRQPTNGARPYPANMLKAKLADWATKRKGQLCTAQHRSMLAGMLEKAVGGKLPRYELSQWLFGSESTSTISCEMVLAALKDWLEIRDWKSEPSADAITEAQAAYAAALVQIRATQKA
jgi:hypothetical protein